MNQVKVHANCPRKTKASCKMLPRIAGCAVALIATALATNSAWALRSCPVYPATIGSCCVADQAGQGYRLGTDLPATGQKSCINISARNVVFDLNGWGLISLKGPVGIGIYVLSTAANATIIDGGLENSTIEGFDIGLKTSAPNTIVFGGVTATFNNRGIIINGPNATVLYSSASANTRNGIILTPAATGSYLLGMRATANGLNGVVLRRTKGVTLSVLTADANKEYGVWLKGASWNSVIAGELEGNGDAGAYLGCHQSGPDPAGCKIPPSEHNSIEGAGRSDPLTVGSCPSGKQNNQPYGVIIDKGNGYNHVVAVVSDDNQNCPSPGDVGYDGYDGNGIHCRRNVWISNNLVSVNQSGFYPGCIW